MLNRPPAPTYERLAEGSIQWPSTEENPDAGARLYTNGKFQTDDGKAQLFGVRSHLPPEEPDPDYQFLLNTGRKTCANNLTLDDSYPFSREPNFKQFAVRIEKVR